MAKKGGTGNFSLEAFAEGLRKVASPLLDFALQTLVEMLPEGALLRTAQAAWASSRSASWFCA
jgi:hypothetical protein